MAYTHEGTSDAPFEAMLLDERVGGLTAETLTPIVRQVTGNPTAVPGAWAIEPMSGGWGGAVGGTALYRVHGVGWSLVLKVLYERPDEPVDAPVYWKREFDLYRSGLLAQLPPTGLRSPTVYATAEFPEACWVWLADIAEEKPHWTFDDYHLVARRLGQFNGAYLTGWPIPTAPWLNVHFHNRLLEPLPETFARLDEGLKRPLIQRALPLSEKEAILAIWQEAPRYAEVLTKLPQTLCHNDAFRRNMFHSDNETILIDWALAGRGAVGEELVALVAISLYLDSALWADLAQFDQAVFDGYVAGLRDAGWPGEARLARLGYLCAMVLRGLAGVRQDVGMLLDEHNPMLRQREQDLGSKEAVADFMADVRRFRLLQMADEARRLLVP
ncbi:MAG: phosphotransferase [Anaerolineales bacterium]|nr:phosphotransferase [Anaerolineales bacterium]